MKPRIRNWAVFVCSMACFGLLIASGSDVFDKSILLLVGGAFLIGSVILLIRNARQPSESRGSFYGQTSWLPSRWRQWITGEEGHEDYRKPVEIHQQKER